MNPTVSFEMEGVARIRGKRSDVLGEHTRTSTGYGIKKKKKDWEPMIITCLRENYQVLAIFLITSPTAKSAVHHPKTCTTYC